MHRIVLSVMALALLLVVASVSPVAADGMFVVDSEADASDQNPGDGQCATTDDTCAVPVGLQVILAAVRAPQQSSDYPMAARRRDGASLSWASHFDIIR
jgi:hypothetical protein